MSRVFKFVQRSSERRGQDVADHGSVGEKWNIDIEGTGGLKYVEVPL